MRPLRLVQGSSLHRLRWNAVAVAVCFAAGQTAGLATVAAEPRSDGPAVSSLPRRAAQLPPAPRPSSDLDGTYVWLGPMGAATWTAAAPSRSGSAWDSAFGADLAVVRVRERQRLGALGGSVGAHRGTRQAGRIWLDAVVGTAIAGHMVGVSAGPVLDLSEDRHPRLGGSIRIWGFIGVAPYARLGVAGSGAFVEMGLHIPLPVFRR